MAPALHWQVGVNTDSSTKIERSTPAQAPAIAFRGISKRFGSLVAVDDVTFNVSIGTVHAILGENGAGKTTLMRMLAGLLRPDSGHLEVLGSPVVLANPREARRLGIGMVHQHLALLPALTVAENLVLDDDKAQGLFSPDAYGHSLAQHATRFGVQIEPDQPVWQLTTAERQVLEICRVLIQGCRFIVLDEPTAHLGPLEGDRLLQQVRNLTRDGVSVLLVTHKLREIETYADDVTVLRRGKRTLTSPVSAISLDDLAHAMVGAKLPQDNTLLSSTDRTASETVLRVENLVVRGRHGQEAIAGVSFEVARGEIFGVAGISGSGQEELSRVLVGLEQPAAGRVSLDTGEAPTVAFIPADRFGLGAPPELSVAENLTLRDYHLPEYSRFGLLDQEALRQLAEARGSRFQVRGDLDALTASLSGGNVQRIILARELSRRFDLLVAHNPSAGLDIAGTAFVRQAILDAAASGAAVVLISDDLDEVLDLAHQVLVLSRGRSEGVHAAQALDRVRIGRLMITGTPSMLLKEQL